MSEKTQIIKGELATIQQRIIAGIIDWAIMAGVIFLLELIPMIFGWISAAMVINLNPAWYTMYWISIILYVLISILSLFAAFFYFVLWPRKRGGQTLGKKFQKTKIVIVEDPAKGTVRDVTKEDLKPLFIRWALMIVDGIFLGAVGLFLIYDSADNQRLGDRIANTAVVLAPE